MNTVEKFCLWDVEFVTYLEERILYLRRLDDLFFINKSIKNFVDVFGKQCKFRLCESPFNSLNHCVFTLTYEQNGVVFKCDKFFVDYNPNGEVVRNKPKCLLYISNNDDLISSFNLKWDLSDLQLNLKATWHTLTDRKIRLPFETYDEFIESTK